MIIENIVCMIVGILIGYAGMYVADYKPTRIKELKSTTRTDNTSVIDALQKRIKELEATISKMETTQKWVSVKDRLPCEDGEYQVVYKHKNGALEASFDEWDNDCQDWMNATDRVAVVYWAELLPPPPTTEENK